MLVRSTTFGLAAWFGASLMGAAGGNGAATAVEDPTQRLRAGAADALAFELRIAGTVGRSQPLATLSVGHPLPAEQTEMLRFNPWTTRPGIRPTGWRWDTANPCSSTSRGVRFGPS